MTSKQLPRFKAFGVEENDYKFNPEYVTLSLDNISKPKFNGVYIPIKTKYEGGLETPLSIKFKTPVLTSTGLSRFENLLANPIKCSLKLNDTVLEDQHENGTLTPDDQFYFQARQDTMSTLTQIANTVKDLLRTEDVLNKCKNALSVPKSVSKINTTLDAWKAAVDAIVPYGKYSKDDRDSYYINPKVFQFKSSDPGKEPYETKFTESINVNGTLQKIKIPYEHAIEKYSQHSNNIFQVVAVIAIDSIWVKMTSSEVLCILQTKLDSLLVLSTKPKQEIVEVEVSDRLLRAARCITSSEQVRDENSSDSE